MDEDLEQLRRLYAEDPVPDERSLGVLRARMAAAFAQETSGAKKRLTARRGSQDSCRAGGHGRCPWLWP